MIAVVTLADVVAEARLWIGTPFDHQQRLRGVAVDCAGVVICVGRALGVLAEDFDENGYARRPDGRTMRALCDQHMDRVPVEQMRAGHVALIAWGVNERVSHLGIVGNYVHGGFSFIHANEFARRKGAKTGGVVEHRLMPHAGMLIEAVYCLRGVEP